MVIMLIYIYQNSYNNEYRINQLEKAILKLNEMNNKLKNELSIYRVRQVNWFSQYEIQSILISNDTIIWQLPAHSDDNLKKEEDKK